MSVMERRYRGFRIVNFAGVTLLLALTLGVYLAKTRASADSAAISRADRLIVAERRQIRALQAQVAGLETPERIEKMSSEYLGMVPIDATHEMAAERLGELASAHAVPPQVMLSTPLAQAPR